MLGLAGGYRLVVHLMVRRRSWSAGAGLAGGAAAIIALVLDFARMLHYEGGKSGALNGPAGTWSWTRDAIILVLIGGCLAAVLAVPRRWPKARPVLVAWCAAAAALILFFTLAPLQVLITVYTAGILAVTARRSPITPATLAISTGIGVGGGLLIVALWNPLQPHGPAASTATRPETLFMVLVAVIIGGTAAAGALAARRVKGTNDPLAVKTRAQQCLAAGPANGRQCRADAPPAAGRPCGPHRRRLPGDITVPLHRRTRGLDVFPRHRACARPCHGQHGLDYPTDAEPATAPATAARPATRATARRNPLRRGLREDLTFPQ